MAYLDNISNLHKSNMAAQIPHMSYSQTNCQDEHLS